MKILITNNTLDTIGGSETYTYALIKELSKQHEVTAYSKRLGMISKLLQNDMINVVDTLPSDPNYFDLVLASHTSTIPDVLHYNCTKVQTCHGIFTSLEQPYKGMDKYVAISEEVQTHLKSKGFDSTIILNGIDCERFKPTKPINKELKTILTLSHSEQLNSMLQSICNDRGIELITRNKYKNATFNVEKDINEADLVVTLGRGCYEAMACGRNVLILDDRHYVGKGIIGDGLVFDGKIKHAIRFNCSGRYMNSKYESKDIAFTIDELYYNWGEQCRAYALEHLNIINQAQKYLDLI